MVSLYLIEFLQMQLWDFILSLRSFMSNESHFKTKQTADRKMVSSTPTTTRTDASRCRDGGHGKRR